MEEDAGYIRYLISGWDKKFFDRVPSFCAKCKCSNLTHDKECFGCKIINEINKKVREKIKNESVYPRSVQTEKYDKWTDEDYFPIHKVPYSCSCYLEYVMYYQKDNSQTSI